MYADFVSDKVFIFEKNPDGSYGSTSFQEISVIDGPNAVDISPDGNWSMIAGNDTFVTLHKSSGLGHQYIQSQRIDVVNDVFGEAVDSGSNFYACDISADS